MLANSAGSMRPANGGTGPAITDSFRLWVDGIFRGLAEDLTGGLWSQVCDDLNLGIQVNTSTLEENHVMLLGQTIIVMTLEEEHRNDDLAFERAIIRIAIKVAYKSMYGENFVVEWELGTRLGPPVK